MELSKDMVEALSDPQKPKILTTVDKDGNPHSVPVGSMAVLEDGNVAFMVLLETSQTQKNMLNCYWFKKEVSIVILDDWVKGKACQIKCNPYKYVYMGPVWDRFLEETWKVLPDSDPAGVWLVTPNEVRDHNYHTRRQAEEDRRVNFTTWITLKGARE